jgi:uncharacterized protein (DUF1330 family)
MAAYVIAHVDVTDPIAYQEYIRMSPESIKAYGGRFLARGGETQVLEGNWQPRRLVILEFASATQARTWWQSPEYAPAKAKRNATSNSELILIDGVPEEGSRGTPV